VSDDCHGAIDYQTDFVSDLCRDVVFEYDVDVAALYHEWEQDKVWILRIAISDEKFKILNYHVRI
jgi:hypothetical protein